MARRKLTPFGRYVRKSMIDMNMQHAELCRQIGCSPSYLTDVLAGRRSGGKYIEPICNVLSIRDRATETEMRV